MAGPETPNPSREAEEKMLKQVEYYAASINAWISTRMELDRSLLTLSAGAIGLLIALLSTSGTVDKTDIMLSAISMIFFVIVIFSCLIILKMNSVHIEDVHNKRASESKFLTILDWLAMLFFAQGVVFAMLFSIMNVSHRYEAHTRKEVKTMVKDARDSGTKPQIRSVNGISKMEPDTTSTGKTGNQDKATSGSQTKTK